MILALFAPRTILPDRRRHLTGRLTSFLPLAAWRASQCASRVFLYAEDHSADGGIVGAAMTVAAPNYGISAP